jgi:hypothetical protein
LATHVTPPPRAEVRPRGFDVAEFLRSQPIPVSAIVLLALAIHGPLLMMEVPRYSANASTHMFFAQHYASHWFSPWNEKRFGCFSQTTAPPLAHQWIALFSRFLNISMAYMVVQLIAVLLLPVGVYRYARLWVGGRSASLAAIASIFAGSLALVVYQAGQLPTVLATALLLSAFSYLYDWSRSASFGAAVKGILLFASTAASDHVTFFLGTALFGLPMVLLAGRDRADEGSAIGGRAAAWSRAAVFGAIGAGIALVVLMPFWIHFFGQRFKQLPVPNGSRDNLLFNWDSALTFWVLPMGALILALPFVFGEGAGEQRLRPLFIAFFIAFVLGLGGTTPAAHAFGGAFDLLTFDRFTFWATLLMLPIVGVLAARLIQRRRQKAVAWLVIAAALSFGVEFAWINLTQTSTSIFNVDAVVNFLGRDQHNKFRYLTLGFGPNFANVAMRSDANTVDGNYGAGKLLPELEPFGGLRLNNAREYGATGMEALRAVLKHANQYGLKYIFVRDRYYEPLLAFAGWRQVESYDNGNVTLWSKEDVPAALWAEPSAQVSGLQRTLWGTLPIGVSLLAIVAMFVFAESRSPVATMPQRRDDVVMPEAI